jgi:hypothetical protein
MDVGIVLDKKHQLPTPLPDVPLKLLHNGILQKTVRSLQSKCQQAQLKKSGGNAQKVLIMNG